MVLLGLLMLLAQQTAPPFTTSLPPVPPRADAIPSDLRAPPPRMDTDDGPSAFACTFARALRGEHCTFEGERGPAEPKDNSAAVAAAALGACAKEAGTDEVLRRQCEHEVAEASLGSQCALRARLVDRQGRLTPEAEGCAETLRLSIARVGRTAALARTCCTCLADAQCKVSGEQCRRELADLQPDAKLTRCMFRSCESECRVNRPESPPPPEKQDPAPPPESPPFKT